MTFRGELFPFQKEAVDMMIDRQHLLLAHGLGLGKTVSSIAALEQLIDDGEVESALIVCPASVKWQWKRQIDKFSDGALVKVIEGSKGKRVAQYREVKRGDLEYVIMNYEQVVSDWDYIRHLAFDAIVCDEVVAIKNPGAKRSRHIKRLRATYQFGLSGQPIENKPEELFSIMSWIDDSVLGRFDIFDRMFIKRDGYGKVKYYKRLDRLRELMSESMHRKTREDVKDQMPAIVEKAYIIDFDPAAQRVYDAIVADLLFVIESVPRFSSFDIANHYAGANEKGPMGDIMPRLMALRMLCDHPKLLTYSADKFDDPDAQAGSAYLSNMRATGMFNNLRSSPKMSVTIDMINDILEADSRNKVVLFSFFKPMLNLIGDALKNDFELFTGDLTPRERDAAVERFTTQRQCRVLLSSDAGGIGVDLPVANFLINYDLPWSAGKYTQRNGRIDRISSLWPEVTLLSMLMRGSIEERMLDMLIEKMGVGEAWLDGKGVDAQGALHLTLGTLKEFLQAA